MRTRASGLGWFVLGTTLAAGPSPTTAQPEGGERAQPAAMSQDADADAIPSLEFLEFLGTWETSSGEWIDPSEVQSDDWPVGSDDPSHAAETETGNAN